MSRRSTVEPSVRYRVALVPGWIASLAVVAPFLAGVSIPPALQYAPLVVSAVLLGLPHGAVDHLAVARTRGKRPDWRAIARVFALYGVVGGTYAVAWFLAPAAAFVLFIAVTWFHWGQGDLYALRALADADHLRTLPQRIGTVLVRGGLPMLVPLLAFPDWYRRVATNLVSLFAPDAVAAIGWAFRADIRTALAVAYGALALLTLAVASPAPTPAGRGCSTQVRHWACSRTSPSSRRCSPSASTSVCGTRCATSPASCWSTTTPLPRSKTATRQPPWRGSLATPHR